MSRALLSLLLASVAVCPAFAAGAAAQEPGPDALRVTLLGTGAPPPGRARMGPATLVEAGGRRLLFDVGRGVSTSVRAHGLKLGDITAVFLTHLHGDHLLGLPDLWLTGHHRDVFGQRPGRLTVYGPTGLSDMLDGLAVAYRGVARRWLRVDVDSIRMVAREFASEGTLFEDEELRVTAFRVVHGDDSYGYRVDYDGRSVVISGDTGYSENLISHAAGADLLVHEVFHVGEDSGMDPAFREYLETIHTTPAAAARVFSQVVPALAVATHLGQSPSQPAALDAGVREGYAGRFVVGEDLMTFLVGDSVVVVRRTLEEPRAGR